MKNFTVLFMMLVVATISLHATVHTVSNNTQSPGQFTNLQTAIDSANAGDSIYVEPSPYDYGTITVQKQLFLFGGGGTPYTYQFNYSTQLDAVNFSANTNYPYNTPDGSIFQGFQTNQGFTINSGLKNITIARNYIIGGMTLWTEDTGMVIINNIISNNVLFIYGQNQNDITALIANNFFYCVPPIRGYGYSEIGVIIQNNIFCGNSTGTGNQSSFFTGGVDYVTVKNNIYYCVGGAAQTFESGCSNCSFLNNITFSTNTDPPTGNQTLPDAGNSGSGNFSNENPDFTVGPAPYTTLSPTTLYTYNWALTSGSPGHLAGTDGTDVGMYGGQFPMPGLETITRLPQVRQLNITNTTVQPNGTLNVNVIGTTHN